MFTDHLDISFIQCALLPVVFTATKRMC